MKLTELRENDNDQTTRISEADMELVYNALRDRGELDQQEVMPLARELDDEYDGFSRGVGSARFIIQRMHVIMHGLAPHGVTEHSAQEMMQPSGPIIKFMTKKGHDVEEAILLAQDEARERLIKRKRPEATEMVMGHYRQVRDQLSPQQDKAIRQSRDRLIQAVMDGIKVEQAFNDLLT